jgi:hypothetical protein
MKHLSNFNSFNNQTIIGDLPAKFQAYVEKLRNSDRDTPLARLARSKMTEDGKYLLIEGTLINTLNGKLVPLSESVNLKFIPTQLPLVNPKLVLNEEFSLSDLNPMTWSTSTILHSIADVASVAADFIVPGSGAVIDAANALSYLIEAQFEDNPEEKQMLYIMAIVTFGFIFLPFVPAGPVKAWIKGGGKVVSSSILNVLKGIWMVFDGLLLKIPSYLVGLLKSPVVTKVLGDKAAKATGAINAFKNTAKKTFKEFLEKRGIKIGEALPASQIKAAAKKGGKEVVDSVVAKEFSQLATPVASKIKNVSPVNVGEHIITPNIKGVNLAEIPASGGYSISWYQSNVLPQFVEKFKKLPQVFDPSKVKILGAPVMVSGREIIEVELEGGVKTLMYKSTGKATPGLKNAGEWFPIAGFAAWKKESGEMTSWFIKSTESVNLVKSNPYMKGLSELLEKGGADGLSKVVSKVTKVSVKEGSEAAAKSFAKALPKIKEGPKLMAKMGFATGKTYRYAFQVGGKNIMGKATIKNITEEGVEVSIKYASGRTVTRVESVSKFMLRSTVLPFQRIVRYTGTAALVPLFVKRFIDSLGPDGTVDEQTLLKSQTMNPDEVVMQSEDLGREIAQYEGESNYTVNQVVDYVQTALGTVDNKYKNILSDNGRLEDPFDGKFGPLTKSALTQYQTDNKLEATGKMDVKTVISITNKLAALKKDPKLVQDLQGLTKGQESNLGLDLLNQAIEAGSKNPPAEKPKADQIIRKPDIGKI